MFDELYSPDQSNQTNVVIHSGQNCIVQDNEDIGDVHLRPDYPRLMLNNQNCTIVLAIYPNMEYRQYNNQVHSAYSDMGTEYTHKISRYLPIDKLGYIQLMNRNCKEMKKLLSSQ